MKPHSCLLNFSILFGAACLFAVTAFGQDHVDGITAVSSKVSKGYTRKKLPDGSIQPEYYAFGEGGKWAGEIADITIDKLHFLDVAHVVAKPLASRKYLPASNPAKTNLLIMVYWGTTAVPEPYSDSTAYHEFKNASDYLQKFTITTPNGGHMIAGGREADAAMAQWSGAAQMLMMINHQRDRTDFSNALMLGYDSPGLIGTERGNYVRGTALESSRDDLYSDIEENRYFVVLMAYDFPILWKQKKHRLLWETRFSISERRNQFDKALPAMAQYASRYFGEDSNGLVRDRIREGNVEVGTPSLIEFVPDLKK